MRHMLMFMLLLFLPVSLVRADMSTPFVDTLRTVGQVAEGRCYVLWDADETENYLVMVTSDTRQHLIIYATAEQGVVNPEFLGRWMLVRAALVTKSTVEGKPEGMRTRFWR